ncbi:MAG: NADH-quinone oxidoreductase subunit NuoF [Calditrichaeota bacterium]|nr:NADH-quinone oxidoreductase subunit NuoF [Calditrichota bacterium]MCB9090384.1 NADH-quinone oxidoreductase subunit NuoF [Calditrichia bacterium]
MYEKVLTKDINMPESRKLAYYEKVGGYRSWKKALKEMDPDAVIELVKASKLRGRGGAGFPTGVKWGFVPKSTDKPHYMLVNADESEPGTFKDRLLMAGMPHSTIEGAAIGSYAIRANTCYIYIRGEFVREARILEEAIAEAYAKGYLGKNIFGSGYDLDMYVHRGAGAYICGEETGLIESLEGKRGWPRTKPPFPAIEGVFRCPTIVNNVETLACVPYILERGAEWFAGIGPESGPGPKLYCLSGHVEKPGVYEDAMGLPLRKLIYEYGGGILNGKKLKAVIPGGSSVPVLTADEIDVDMDFDSLAKIGSMLGSAGCIVMDEDTDMVNTLLNIAHFYRHESCGQCTPCREGTTWAEKVLHKIKSGHGTMKDVDLLYEISGNIGTRTICPLGDAAAMPIESFVRKFRHEFEAYVTKEVEVA